MEDALPPPDSPQGTNAPLAMPPAPTPTTNDPLDACVNLLRGPSDEHRIVGLLMLTKHISLLPVRDVTPAPGIDQTSFARSKPTHNSSRAQEVRSAVATALDPSFLKRLLITEQTLPGKKDGSASSTDALALSMLSFFCSDSKVAKLYSDTLPTIISKLKPHVEALRSTRCETSGDKYERNMCMVLDGLRCLCAFTLTSDILPLVKVGIVTLCISSSFLSSHSPAGSKDLQHVHKDIRMLSLSVLQRCFKACPTASVSVMSEEQLLFLAEMLCSVLPKSSANKIASANSPDQILIEEDSLCALRIIEQIVRAGALTKSANSTKEIFGHPKWVALVRQGVHGALQNRLSEIHRNRCFSVCNCMLSIVGAGWAVPSKKVASKKRKSSSRTFVVLLIQLVCVEVRLIIDLIARLLVDSLLDQDLRLEEHQRLDHALAALPICFSLIEQSVEALCDTVNDEGTDGKPGPWVLLTSTDMLSLRDALVNAVKAICNFVVYVGRESSESSIDFSNGTGDAPEKVIVLENTVSACLRVVGMWLTVDADSIMLEAGEMIRYVLGRRRLLGFKKDGGKGSVQQFFIGPSLVALLQESSARSDLYDCDGHKTIAEYAAQCLLNAKSYIDHHREKKITNKEDSSLADAIIGVLEVCAVLVQDYGPSDARGIDNAREFSRSLLRKVAGQPARALRSLLLQPPQQSDAVGTQQLFSKETADYVIELLEVSTLSLDPGPRGF